MLSSRRPFGAVVLALVLALTGCGSGGANGGAQNSGEANGSGDAKPAAPKGSDPVTWTGAFCSGPNELIAGAITLGTAQETPQGKKDWLLAFADSSHRALADAARRLEQVGPPGIADGKRIHDTAVSFFTSAAESVADQRAKLAALDPNDPEFVQKISGLAGPDLGATRAQLQQLGSNQELVPAFRASPECQRLMANGPR